MLVFYSLVLLLFMLSLVIGLLKLAREKQPVNRFLVLQLMGTISVAVLVLIAGLTMAQGLPLAKAGILDLALCAALLAAVTVSAFVQRGWRNEGNME